VIICHHGGLWLNVSSGEFTDAIAHLVPSSLALPSDNFALVRKCLLLAVNGLAKARERHQVIADGHKMYVAASYLG